MNLSFRQWCNEKYLEYKDEILEWTHRAAEEEAKDYFQRNKWFLKKKYRQEHYNKNISS